MTPVKNEHDKVYSVLAMLKDQENSGMAKIIVTPLPLMLSINNKNVFENDILN